MSILSSAHNFLFGRYFGVLSNKLSKRKYCYRKGLMTSILEIQAIQKKGEPRLLLEAWQRFEKEEIGDDRNLTVQELAEKFLARQKAQGRSPRTLIDDRSRLNAMTMTQLTSVQLIEAALWRELGSTEPQSFSTWYS